MPDSEKIEFVAGCRVGWTQRAGAKTVTAVAFVCGNAMFWSATLSVKPAGGQTAVMPLTAIKKTNTQTNKNTTIFFINPFLP